jgi:hypothetical protein
VFCAGTLVILLCALSFWFLQDIFLNFFHVETLKIKLNEALYFCAQKVDLTGSKSWPSKCEIIYGKIQGH